MAADKHRGGKLALTIRPSYASLPQHASAKEPDQAQESSIVLRDEIDLKKIKRLTILVLDIKSVPWWCKSPHAMWDDHEAVNI